MAHSLPSMLARLAAITDRQHGLFTTAQAGSVGLPKSFLDHRCRIGELIAVDHHVYRSALTPRTWHQRLLAVCLGAPATASHRSAGVLWHAPDLSPDWLEVTAVRHRRRKAPDVIWHESYLLQDDQTTEIDGIPVTNPTRTLLDLAAVVDDAHLLRVYDAFVRRRLTNAARVGEMFEALGPRRPGAKRIRRVLELRMPGHAVRDSDLETVFENLLREAGLPTPTAQRRVRAPHGRTMRVDYVFDQYTVAVELFGAEFHASPEQWADDMSRLTTLSALGWHVLTFTYEDVHHRPEMVMKSVRNALLRAGFDIEREIGAQSDVRPTTPSHPAVGRTSGLRG